METKTKADLSKYIVNVQGKDFITFPGLLAEAHAQGLTSITTDLVTPLDLANPIVKATVVINNKSFTGYGDANSNNVAKKVAGALIRMSETRAVARALRFGCNIDMTAVEEIGVDDEDTTPSPIRTTFSKRPTVVTENVVGPVDSPVVPGNTGTVTLTPPVLSNNTTTETKRTFSKRPTTKTEPNF